MNRKYLSIGTKQSLISFAFLMAGIFAVANAHEGHKHDKEIKPQSTVAAAPTLTAVSENYELVATVKGRQMTVYLDQFESNVPVIDADLEFDFSGTVVKATRNPDGTYVATLPKNIDLKRSLPVTVTIVAPAGADLLSGDLVISAVEQDSSWISLWVLVALVVSIIVLLLAWLAYRRKLLPLIQMKQKLPAFMRRFFK
jgi:hypothetical protein